MKLEKALKIDIDGVYNGKSLCKQRTKKKLNYESILLNFFNSVISEAESVSLLLYFAFKNNTLLCCGYFESICSINFPEASSFSNIGLFSGSSDFCLVGIFLMIDSSAASRPGRTPFIFEALSYKPCNCFLLSHPRLWYC